MLHNLLTIIYRLSLMAIAYLAFDKGYDYLALCNVNLAKGISYLIIFILIVMLSTSGIDKKFKQKQDY